MSNATAPFFTIPLRALSPRGIIGAMTRIILGAVAATILALAVPPAIAQPSASAQTPGCVSAREYGQVFNGKAYTKLRVHRIFDTRGVMVLLDPEAGTQARNYRMCDRHSTVTVYYRWSGDRHWRLWGGWITR